MISASRHAFLRRHAEETARRAETVLDLIGRDIGASTGEVMQHMEWSNRTARKYLHKLEADGVIYRTHAGTDARARWVKVGRVAAPVEKVKRTLPCVNSVFALGAVL